MARNTTPAPESKETPVDLGRIALDIQAANTLALMETTAAENVLALAQQLGYDGALSVGALEDGIRFYQQRTAEACLELGKRLALLKEASLHGEFLPRLELLGIDARAAQRFMAVADKFSKASALTLLKTANSRAKLLELVVLDDSELTELAETGSVRGMATDDIANMGYRELRSKLREARAEKVADDKLVASKNTQIDKLSRHIAKATPDEVLAELHKEASTYMSSALYAIKGELRLALIAVRDHNSDQDNTLFMAGLVGQVQADLSALREEFNLPDVSNAADAQLVAEMAQWSQK